MLIKLLFIILLIFFRICTVGVYIGATDIVHDNILMEWIALKHTCSDRSKHASV